MTGLLLDTHCHLVEYPDPPGVLAEGASAGVRVIAVTEDPGQYRLLRTRLGSLSNVEVALGLHPLRAGTATDADVARLLRLLPRSRWIGEVGLDFSSVGTPTKRAQIRVFETLLSEPLVCARPMTVHSRGAAGETVDRLVDAGAHAIVHWYTGPLDIAERALAGGLYFSVNPAMLTSEKGAGVIRLVPPDRVLLETDGPYTRWGSRTARPSDLPDLVVALAKRWLVTVADAKAIITSNQDRFVPEVG